MIKKGGVATVVTIVILAGIVIALIVSVVIPMSKNAWKTGDTTNYEQSQAKEKLDFFATDVRKFKKD